jgi:hypothetical protein
MRAHGCPQLYMTEFGVPLPRRTELFLVGSIDQDRSQPGGAFCAAARLTFWPEGESAMISFALWKNGVGKSVRESSLDAHGCRKDQPPVLHLQARRRAILYRTHVDYCRVSLRD